MSKFFVIVTLGFVLGVILGSSFFFISRREKRKEVGTFLLISLMPGLSLGLAILKAGSEGMSLSWGAFLVEAYIITYVMLLYNITYEDIWRRE